MSVSNAVSPLMVYVDRFLIGNLLSIVAVAYYATPYEVATKLLIVPSALVGVLFPAFSTAMASDRSRGAMLYRRAVKYAGIFIFPISFLIIVFSQDMLQVWLGREFAVHSTRVLQILSVGVLANGLAMIPFALIQGTGRADITGKLHMLELPFYMFAVWYLTVHNGITGTAIAWLLRVTVDCILLFILADGFMGARYRILWPVCISIGVCTAAVLILAMIGVGVIEKSLASIAILLSFAATTWFVLLESDERIAIRHLKSRLVLSRLYPKSTGA